MSRATLKTKPRTHWSITDGRTGVGTVTLRQGLFVAVDLGGTEVGAFATLWEAANALQRLAQAEKA